ncbi:uncharacterized protein [Amphiura filiformis]|uniref:uncharacterized protein n=1 Tax=Amphiura filiformis TaxID=82378 RepID=UPI003B21C03E
MSSVTRDAQPLRVLLWALPRTLSTAFEKCIGSMPGVQIINEPYAFAYCFGPDGKVAENPDTEINKTTKAMLKQGAAAVGPDVKSGWFHESVCTFQWVKDTLEAPYPGKSLVFAKDQCYSITDKLHMIPRGFRHTFLIRHPHKVFPSWKGITWKFIQTEEGGFRLQDMPEPFIPKRYGYAEMCDLVEFVKQRGDPNPVLIDADDLQTSPASIMRQYCDAIGIPFNESMLQWPAGTDHLDDWIINSTFVSINKIPENGGFYEAAFNSTHFKAPSKIPSRSDLTDDILELVDASMPYYEKLYEMRIKP